MIFRGRRAELPAKLPLVEYDEGATVRNVRHNGEILVYLSEVLAQEPVGLTQVDTSRWELRYNFHLPG